jgi:hypothetical protein
MWTVNFSKRLRMAPFGPAPSADSRNEKTPYVTIKRHPSYAAGQLEAAHALLAQFDVLQDVSVLH